MIYYLFINAVLTLYLTLTTRRVRLLGVVELLFFGIPIALFYLYKSARMLAGKRK